MYTVRSPFLPYFSFLICTLVPVVVELLVSSCLAVILAAIGYVTIFIPVDYFHSSLSLVQTWYDPPLQRRVSRFVQRLGSCYLYHVSGWSSRFLCKSIMALQTMRSNRSPLQQRRWPNFIWCIGSQSVCQILDAVVAFSWINFVITMVLAVLWAVDDEEKERHGGVTNARTPA